MDSDGSDIEKAIENDDNQLDHINQEKHEYVVVNQHFCVYACLEAYKEHSPCNISMCHSCYESKKSSQNNKMRTSLRRHIRDERFGDVLFKNKKKCNHDIDFLVPCYDFDFYKKDFLSRLSEERAAKFPLKSVECGKKYKYVKS